MKHFSHSIFFYKQTRNQSPFFLWKTSPPPKPGNPLFESCLSLLPHEPNPQSLLSDQPQIRSCRLQSLPPPTRCYKPPPASRKPSTQSSLDQTVHARKSETACNRHCRINHPVLPASIPPQNSLSFRQSSS